jgi:hypothetical protein
VRSDSPQSGSAAGQQREQVGAVAHEIERVDRRLVLEQAAPDVLHPGLGTAAVAGPREVVEVVAVGQEQHGVAATQRSLPRPGAHQLLIGTVAHDAQVHDREVRYLRLDQRVEAFGQIDRFPECEGVGQRQQPSGRHPPRPTVRG